MHLPLELSHFYLNQFVNIPGSADDRRNGQRINIASQFDGASNRSG